jgi:hypothetical protein
MAVVNEHTMHIPAIDIDSPESNQHAEEREEEQKQRKITRDEQNGIVLVPCSNCYP